jgi:hypothetical protein
MEEGPDPALRDPAMRGKRWRRVEGRCSEGERSLAVLLGAQLMEGAAAIAGEQLAELRGALEQEGGDGDNRRLGLEGSRTELAGAGMLG